MNPTSTTTRFHFVDLLRGWAVLVMIETHVFNALLLPSIKDETPFKILTFINGLVAPTFLFCAGFALAITLSRKWAEFTGARPALGRYLLRLLFILGIAYSLHIPRFSLRQMMELTDEHVWMVFFQADILHVIALTLIFLSLLTVILRRRDLVESMAALTAVIIIFASPLVRDLDYSQTAIWLRPYLTMQFKSQFPLFPWSAFLIGGYLIGAWFLRAREKSRERVFVNRALGLAFVALIVSLIVEALPWTVYPHHDFWRASPEFFFVRIALVLIAMAGLWKIEQSHETSGGSVISLFGQESLIVYVAHLLIVYGYTFDFSFIRMYGPTLNYLQCTLLLAGLVVLMYALAFGWHRMKAWNGTAAKIAQFAVIGGTVCYFVMR